MSSYRQALPTPFRIAVVLAALFLLLPLVALLWRTPWNAVLRLATREEVLGALWLSLQCSASAALACCVLGLPLAAWLAGGADRLRTVVRVLVTLPMVLPPVVGGVALLLAYGRNGVVGGPLREALGLVLPFTTGGVIVAETYVAMPFFVLTVEGGLRSFDPRYAQAAATLGASPWRTWRTVVLPMIAPSLGAGLLVAWARALGEFGATITFAGNLAGSTRTMPLAVYTALETDPEAATVLSLVLLLVCAGILFALRRRWFPLR